jgi:hypothetical protein
MTVFHSSEVGLSLFEDVRLTRGWVPPTVPIDLAASLMRWLLRSVVCTTGLIRGRCTCERTTEPEVRDVDRYHQPFVDRKQFFISHVRPSPGRKCDTLQGNVAKDILRGSESSRRFYTVVVSAKEKIGPEVKILFAAVAGDLRRERYT